MSGAPSGRLEAVRRRLRGLRYAASDVWYVARRSIRRFWAGRSPRTRTYLLGALAVVAALLVAVIAVIPNLPCRFPGGDACPPDDDAEQLIPAEALAYLHANLEPESEQYELAGRSLGSVPLLGGQIIGRALALVPGADGVAPSFETDIRPWFGGEAAVAVIAVGGGATQVELLEVADAEAAAAYATSIAAGRPEVDEYLGVELAVDQRGLASAQVDGFLVIGPAAGVRAVIEVGARDDGSASLADDPAARDLRAELSEHRLAEAYLTAEGAALLIGARSAGLAPFAPLVDPAATRGVAASLTATEDGLELAVRSALDPERALASPGFFAAFPAFEPALPERVSEQALGYLGFGDPGATAESLLAQATTQAPGIAAGFRDLGDRLRRQGGVDLERELLDALGGEAAVALEPRGAGARSGLPYLELVTEVVDEEAARRALASLQGPLAGSVDPGDDRQAPVFGERRIEGVEAGSLRVSPTVELTYAVFDALAVIATDAAAIGQLARAEGGLAESELYRRAIDGLGRDEVSLLGFADLGALVEVGEQLGLSEDPAYATFAADFRRLGALGLTVTSEPEMLSTDARLLFAQTAD